MREIKFRGLRTDDKGWVYGQLAYLFNNKEMPYIMSDCFFGTKDFGEEDDNGNPIIENDFLALGGFVSVKPDSVGQVTGLHDKNGNEIYEWDICININTNNKGFVRFDYGWAIDYTTRSHNMPQYYCEDLEIIGNIHENPELL